MRTAHSIRVCGGLVAGTMGSGSFGVSAGEEIVRWERSGGGGGGSANAAKMVRINQGYNRCSDIYLRTLASVRPTATRILPVVLLRKLDRRECQRQQRFGLRTCRL